MRSFRNVSILLFALIVLAGCASSEVTQRRTMTNEFIAKPFSAVMVAQRLQVTIERPRQYIYSPTYFGPDRRRQAVPVTDDRRKTTDEEIEVIYAGKALGDLGASKKKIWCFRLPNRLQQKLSTGEAGEPNEPMFDPDLLDEAEEKIVNMETDYSDWVGDSVKSLTQELASATENPNTAPPHLKNINEIALEIRGQGSMFGYPLMTEFGKSLYEFTVTGHKVTPQLLELVKAHIDLINVVIQGKMKGDGGKVGADLLTSLDQAKKKYAGKEKEKA